MSLTASATATNAGVVKGTSPRTARQALTRSTKAQGPAGVTSGEHVQGPAQPLPGMYSVEVGDANGEVREEGVKESEVYQLQHEEKRRRKRRSRLNLTADYHVCEAGCNHGLPPPPPRAHKGPVTPHLSPRAGSRSTLSSAW